MIIKKSMMTTLSAFLEKQNPYQNAYIYFCHVTLIIFNKKFQF